MEYLQYVHEEYGKFLQNKKVAIVGPAESIFFNESGKYIDTFDIIIRINRGFEMITGNESYVGSRTDVLYNALDFRPGCGGTFESIAGIANGVKFICCPYTPRPWHNIQRIETLATLKPIRFMNADVYNKLQLTCGTASNSGTASIVDILQYNIQQLYITGIDFYRSLYSSKYPPQVGLMDQSAKAIEDELGFKRSGEKGHNPDHQYLYFKKLVNLDKRIKLDPFLTKIIKDNRYDKWDTIPRK
jgi:hypothetical protein